MSWLNIAKNMNKSHKKNILQNKSIEPLKILNQDEENLDKLFELYNGCELFNDLIYIKENCERYTPWLLSEINTNDLYTFIHTFVNIENTMEDKRTHNLGYSSEDSSSTDEYNDYDM